MDFIEEYNAMNDIPIRVAVTYKCIELFKVITKETQEHAQGIYFGKNMFDGNQSINFLEAMKKFIKEKKSLLRNCQEVPVKSTECVKIIWFIYQKLVENGVFTDVERRDIMSYLDICEYVVL